MKPITVCLIVVLSGLAGNSLTAQVHDFDSLLRNNESFQKLMEAEYKGWDIFSTPEVMRVSLTSDFKNLIKRKYKGEYQDAVFKLYLNDTVVITRAIKIKPRGNIRRKVCAYPPIKLNFPKEEVFLEQFREFDKTKMVVRCRNSESHLQYLLSEYYAYKLYNLITDYSFRVKLMEITYIDNSGKNEVGTGYAFLIENIDQLAKRHEAMPIIVKNINERLTDLDNLANIYIYQYLIGNEDWSIPVSHNIDYLKFLDPTVQKIFPIPYDFDYSGIVNTSYAVANEELGLKSVRERVYLGRCIDEAYINKAISGFIDKQQEIYSLYNDSLLDERNLKSTISYLDEFYSLIKDERAVNRNIIERCWQ